MSGFAQSPFGDGSTAGNGNVVLTVSNHYGERDSKFASGKVKTEGMEQFLSLNFDYVAATADELPLTNPVIPAGARITKIELVTKVQGVAATGAVIDIGTSGSEATNGATAVEANLETAAGSVTDLTSALAGTWDAEAKLAADTTVNINLSGGVCTAGEWDVEITYVLARP